MGRELHAEWEKRYTHERDLRDSQLMSLGLPPIIDDSFGCLRVPPDNIWRRFDGTKFWPIMRQKGHTSCDFASCDCSHRLSVSGTPESADAPDNDWDDWT